MAAGESLRFAYFTDNKTEQILSDSDITETTASVVFMIFFLITLYYHEDSWKLMF